MFTLYILENNQVYTVKETDQKMVSILLTYFGARFMYLSYEGV